MQPALPAPSHDDHGHLLFTSKRPGGSKYQYVQKNQATGLYKVLIPHKGKRQFGPCTNEIDAAKKVQKCFKDLDDGAGPLTRDHGATVGYK